jgi:hypothetical protein
MHSFFGFVFLCFKEAFRHSRGVIDLCATALGLAIPFVQWLHPSWLVRYAEATVNALYWQVPVAVVSAVVWARLVLSPYWVYCNAQKKHATEQAKLKDALDKARRQLDTEKRLLREKRRRKEFATKLALIMDNGRELAYRCVDSDISVQPDEEEIGLWTDSVYAALSMNAVDSSGVYVARYNAARDTSGTVFVGIHLDRSRDHKRIMSKVDVLGEFIKELMQPS